YAERALRHLETGEGFDPRLKMELLLAIGATRTFTLASSERTAMALSEALRLAGDLDDLQAQLRILWAQCAFQLSNGACRAAHATAEQFARIAPRIGDPTAIAGSHRLLDNTFHWTGNQVEARRHLEQALDLSKVPRGGPRTMWFHFD